MAVSLTVSDTLDGAAVSDALTGGVNPGIDLGSVINGSWTPVTNKATNDGVRDVYIAHNGVNEITDVGTFVQQYGTGSGNTYGGAKTASDDFNAATTGLKALGQNSGSSKNNGDGLSGGLWVDHDWDSSLANQFDFATNGGGSGNDTVIIYGDNGTEGVDLASAEPLRSESCVYNAPGETNGSAPVDQKIGPAGNTTQGDAAHVKMRFYLPLSHPDGGVIQFEWVIKYSATN